MSGLWFDLAIVTGLVVVNALLAGAEMAFVSLREGQLQGLAAAGGNGARVVELARHPNRYLSAVQLGITLAGFLASATAAVSISKPVADLLGGGSVATPVAVASVTVLLALVTLVLGELVPKRLAMQRAERWSQMMARPISGFITVTRPVIVVLSALTDLLVRAAGGDPDRRRDEITQAELVGMVESQPTLTDVQRQIMAGAIEIADRPLRHVLVPRNRVVTVDAELAVSEARQLLRDAGHSRAPVVRGTLDEPVGQVHLRDLFTDRDDAPAETCTTPLEAFPETVSVLEALRRLQSARSQMALVIDEHGGAEGIITVEDLVEELVGEIYDEADRDLWSIEREDDGALVLPGSFPVHDLVDLGVAIPEGHYSTVAGLVLDALGRIPEVGQRAEVDGVGIEVVAMDRRAITSVRVTAPAAPVDATTLGDGDGGNADGAAAVDDSTDQER